MMAGKLWTTVLLSLALSGFFCEEVTISNSSQGTTGSPMINATSAAKNTTSMSTIATTTIKDQSFQTPHIRANKTDRLENVTEVGPKITAGTTEPSTKIPMTSAFSLGPAILDQSSQSPDKQTNTTVRLEKASEAGPKNNSILTNQEKQDDTSYSGIILPVVIALIVISVIVFLLMALYRMCLKTTPERQENGTEQAPSDKENVKLISVKTTSSDSGMFSFLTLSSYDLPLGMSLPLESFKPIADFSGKE
ncbi:endomucin isoform X2 [Protobothrops mucrosquamatus]|uniref:endomucin isoform X2 n=1 Tax=Protobothrops mucrosquamatus TaxID=103944 RepID=UPI0007756384|nr:endomucin isoform X2 [Protobothrops mucrosquamatus]